MSRWILVVLALIIGAGVTAADRLLFTLLTGKSIVFNADLDLSNAILVAIPYLALALTGVQRRLPWLVGLALTLSLWGSALYGRVSYQWHPDGSGADILSGLMMLVSPLLFTPIVLAVADAQRNAVASG